MRGSRREGGRECVCVRERDREGERERERERKEKGSGWGKIEIDAPWTHKTPGGDWVSEEVLRG